MRLKKSNWNVQQLIPLKGDDWFKKQKQAGKAVAKCLQSSKNIIENCTPNISPKDIEHECLNILKDMECTPTFEGYKGFPGSICVSINKQLVHGIPNDHCLLPGDVVKVDLGATYDGVIADAAITAFYGKPKSWDHERMVRVCKESLDKAITSIEVGKRLGTIGYAIYNHIKKSGYKLITHYGGHGINLNEAHAAPFVSNKSRPDEGIRIQPGLTIAIEPMLAIGSDKTTVANDSWTVLTKDISCHWEHTIYVGEDKVHVMTDWEEKYEN